MRSPTAVPFEAEPVHVLVVSADISRVMATRRAVCVWPLRVNVEWVCTWHEALRRARELPATLVVVDCNEGVTEGRALARHLLRHQPGLEALSFIDAEADGPRPTPRTGAWPWLALPRVLDEWVDQHLALAGAASESASESSV